jgi:hypothetical protein
MLLKLKKKPCIRDSSCLTPGANVPAAARGRGSRPGGIGRKRPPPQGQGPAKGRKAGRKAGSDDEDDNHDEGEGGDEPSEHAVRKQREYEDWVAAQPQLEKELVDALPLCVSMHQLQTQQAQQRLQALAVAQHEHAISQHACSNCQHGTRCVTYVGLSCECRMEIPTLRCMGAGVHVGPGSPAHPLRMGCFPSTCAAPETYYDLQVMELYRRLGPMDGLSVTGAAKNGLRALA